MEFRPIEHKSKGAARRIACQYLKRLEVNRRLMFLVVRVEMRRGMVAVIHPNDNSEKRANGRHERSIGAAAQIVNKPWDSLAVRDRGMIRFSRRSSSAAPFIQ